MANKKQLKGINMLNKQGQINRVAKIVPLTLLLLSAPAMAENNTPPNESLADMSDPLAVFTMAGFGVTNRGLNLKAAKSYDTGNTDKLGMNVIEIKGIYSDTLGWESNTKDSVDSLRVRNLTVNTINGRGAQIDMSYDLNSEAGSLSYSLLQALPAWGRFNLYPLGGVGIAFANNALQDDGTVASGYSLPGTFATVGMYGKFTVTDKIWLNYNPIWNASLSGSDLFKDHGFDEHSSSLMHEFIVSYQISPRSNVRYFANWTQYVDLSDGDHRIEYNYQF
ncbi:MAG: hypothetical protein ACI808_000533 [Paraglaciecola sp.]|jgi:hypothetical protein